MTSPTVPAEAQQQTVAPAAVEAARYALLRRLAPAMRHHLVVNLQPIGMLHEVMDRRLRAAEPDLAKLHEGVHKINGFARAALQSSIDMVTWLAPEEGAVTTVADGVRECMGLVATGLGFRGYALRHEAADVPGTVGRAALRNVLTAALLHLTDEATPPADLVLQAQARDHGLELQLQRIATTGDAGFSVDLGYRPLARADLEALAAAEAVALVCEAASIRLTLAWVQPPAA
ncbi:hypothetical protein [uncultured Ramlibacter sp.]|uniref:hypothetical protein n=1 Tax=uncultured Ramlibacter sp. TaxID=260755 RepID=UPI002612901F|nr:hypothetical protein [uncultured Ramlibacter sp.]